MARLLNPLRLSIRQRLLQPSIKLKGASLRNTPMGLGQLTLRVAWNEREGFAPKLLRTNMLGGSNGEKQIHS